MNITLEKDKKQLEERVTELEKRIKWLENTEVKHEKEKDTCKLQASFKTVIY